MTEFSSIGAGIRECMQNRELSWLKFNERVLEESNFPDNPPLEKLKFISIFCSNLDEFFMIRVGSLTDYMMYAPEYTDNKTGLTAEGQLKDIFSRVSILYGLVEKYFIAVTEELKKNGIHHMKVDDLDTDDMEFLEGRFEREIMPLLSPQVIDNRHPFPHINNKWMHIGVRIKKKEKLLFGLIAVPKILERVIFLDNGKRFVLLEDVIRHFAHIVFRPYEIVDRTVLTVTRNADINTEDHDEDVDYRVFMQALVKKRQRLTPVRLEFQFGVGREFKEFFMNKLDLKEDQVFVTSAPLDLSYSFGLEGKLNPEASEGLARPSHTPAETYTQEMKADIMKQVQRKDVLLSYPFESMSPFVEMIRKAAEDPAVMSIKITLYRLDSQSRLAESLIRAAENGKEIVVLMELRARFDENNNIEWSKRLEEAGCHVMYGLPGYKVHSKICLITRKDGGKIQYVTQIGTGNYNEKTSKLYTDLSLITADQNIGRDAQVLFNNLLIANTDGTYERLWVAPNSFKNNFMDLLEKEIEKGDKGRVIIKCNSLTDKEVILKLIEASRNGVKVSMIVRGICCLMPGIPGFTDNISVISIVGRFLEHSRIFCFGEGDEKKMFFASADLMTRNTERRVEIGCPVYDEDHKKEISGMLDIMLSDNVKAWEKSPDGSYTLRHPSSPGNRVNSQETFVERARKRAEELPSAKERTAERGGGFGAGMIAFFSKRS
ncbi:MAG: polyphosphate kinase 1 [Methanomassiliicoccaceae archaeon]|nr:polyphosphate kinase 1 [Methanomassiliicoccaceae archaeon]